MRLDQIDLQQAELNDLLDAYERARVIEGDVDLRDCLPRQGHPLYLEARRELVRLDMDYGWQNRCPKRLAVYVAMFPDLLDDAQSAQDITFEEYRLRVLVGEDVSAMEYGKLYGVDISQWPGSDAAIDDFPLTEVATPAPIPPLPFAGEGRGDAAPPEDTDADTVVNRLNTPPLEWDVLNQAAFESQVSLTGETAKALLQNKTYSHVEVSFLLAQALTTLPAVGTRFLNFHLIAELGRGSFGCVYLARQSGLADRLVALKLTVDLEGEEQKLAQLQHTNVVPIYSAHKTKTLHAFCMPYFGPTTLADVIRHCKSSNALPETGSVLVTVLKERMTEFLKQTGARASVPKQTGAPTLTQLEKMRYVEAVLWLAARMADGLTHAHVHGILHGDLKPANILLTEEGQPMLLDFNLATDIKVQEAVGELRVGGTLPYMAPEHLSALQGGDKSKVNTRSDIYALGVILFELLSGKTPFESKRGTFADTLPVMIAERMQGPPALRPLNPAISPAVESIVRHCLEPDANKRYQSAQELHEDLERHAQHLPLKHALEPSLRERGAKWLRRHPQLTSPLSVIFVSLMLLAALLTPGAWRAWKDWQAARQSLDQTQKKLQSADELARDAQSRAKSAEAGFKAIKQYRDFHSSISVARELMDRVTLVRMCPETLPLEEARLQKDAEMCRKLLAAYSVLGAGDWQAASMVTSLPPAELASLRADVASLLYVLAETELFRADQRRPMERSGANIAAQVADWMSQPYVRRASEYKEQARRCYAEGALPQAFLYQQAKLAKRAGDLAKCNALLAEARSATPREDVDDAYWTACSLAAQEKATDPDRLLAVAARPLPEHFAAWRLRALCYQAAAEYRKAETCWDPCVALKPGDDWSRYYRGQASLRLRKWAEAKCDFDAFINAHPEHRDAYILRATAHARQNENKEAIADLTKALDLGPVSPELLFRRLKLMEKCDDNVGAERDRVRLLSTEMDQPGAWLYRGMVQAQLDPNAALAELDRAVAKEPANVAALYQKALVLADRLDRPVEAVGTLDRLLSTDANHTDALLKRGFLYAKAGLRKTAVADADRALKGEMTAARYHQAASIFAHTSKETASDRERVLGLMKAAFREGYSVKDAQNDANLPLDHIPGAAEVLRAAAVIGPMTRSGKD